MVGRTLVMGAMLLAGSRMNLVAQQPVEPPAASFAFDVATIKPSDPGIRGFGGGFVASGYNAVNFPLSEIVLRAYFPYSKGNQLIGVPAWAAQEHYDIVGHIDEATAPSWLKLDPGQRAQAGRPMLQKLLAERCKLVVHTIPSQVDGYALVIGKRGSRLQPAQHRDTYPDGVKNADYEGGKVLPATLFNNNTESFFNASIRDLVNFIGGPPTFSVIQDRTNLIGRYDFTIRRLENPVDADGNRIPDPQPSDLWDISATGLELKRAKLPSQNLVIDHIERPSPN
jgi:uncharacterized protein (TIGR03435 family)